MNTDFRFNDLNNSRIKILGILEKRVKVNEIDVIRFFVLSDKTMNDTALLGRDFTSHQDVEDRDRSNI